MMLRRYIYVGFLELFNQMLFRSKLSLLKRKSEKYFSL